MNTTLVSIRDRFELYRDAHPAVVASFGDDVRMGLAASPKRLPPKYFYDDLGSSLFEAITRLPEYYLTRTESALLRTHAHEMVAALGGPVDMIELGSGSASKTRFLIEAALAGQDALHYRPVDISPEALISSSHALLEQYDRLSITAYASDYTALLDGTDLHSTDRTLALFLGSNIGNFEVNDAAALMRGFSRALSPGDGLLLGTDLKKAIDVLELAYDDPTGVTAAFNKNVLARINRELGGTFDLRGFEHEAHYDPVRGSVDSFLVAQRAMRVTVQSIDLEVHFNARESIHTESSYKYSHDDIERLAVETGFTLARQWIDPRGEYALSLLRVG